MSCLAHLLDRRTRLSRRGTVLLALAVALASSVLLAPTAQAAPPAPSSVAAAPGVTKSRSDALGSGGRHMSTEVTWFPAADGRPDRLVGTTRTWNNVKMTGFTGSVLVLFVNDRGQTVGYSPVKHPLGVDGKWIGRWSRTDAWQFDIAADQVRGAVGIEIVHSRGKVDRLRHMAEGAKQVANVASVVRLLVTG